MDESHSTYRSFLIRFHRSAGEPHWRVTLQDVQSRSTVRFATEHELIEYLLNCLRLGDHSQDSDGLR